MAISSPPISIILVETEAAATYYLIDCGAIAQPRYCLGTPGYAPNEQSAGRPCLSSDVFALGCVAIELLLGKVPDLERRHEHLEAVRRKDSGLPHMLERLSNPDPEQRYPHAAAALEALAALNLKTPLELVFK